MSLAQQHQYIFYNDKVRLGRHRIINNRDDISIDSTSSCLTEKVPRATIYRSACKNWRYDTTVKVKKAWKSRASTLNNRKLPGKFLHIPFSIERHNSIESRVLQALTYEWDNIVTFFKNCITRDPRKSTSSMVYTFGKEKVPVLSQTYREFRFSFLMERTLFGDNLSILKKNEVVLKTKKQVLLHICSQKRMKTIFSKEASNATEFLVDKYDINYTHSCCAKINVLFNKKNIIGYILEESRGKWKILLENNKIIYKNLLKYSSKRNEYIYKTTGKYLITFYWPIRILMKYNGKGVRITLNRVH